MGGCGIGRMPSLLMVMDRMGYLSRRNILAKEDEMRRVVRAFAVVALVVLARIGIHAALVALSRTSGSIAGVAASTRAFRHR
jgi:hypothetical protein